jgi:CBS domain-containing protein
MTPSPRTLRPRDGVAFAINWMAIEGFRNVPIVDDAGAVLGVLTVWDVMRHLGEVFDEIEATPKPVPPQSEISEVINMVDLGGGG